MRLQSVLVDFGRRRAADALAKPPEELGGYERSLVRMLAVCLEGLGQIQRNRGVSECVKSIEESLGLSERIGDKVEASVCTFNLGQAYLQLAEIRDLDQADRWYRRSLKLYEELHDSLSQRKCWGSLGHVTYARFDEARAARKSPEDQLRHLNDALQSYQKALKLIPPNAVGDLATTHSALGQIYINAGDIGQALAHCSKAIRYFEIMGDLFNAARARYNVAVALAGAGRFSDALDYAEAALQNFEPYSESAAAKIQKTRELTAYIEQAMKSQG